MKTNLITSTAVLALAGLLFSGSANAADPVSATATFNLVLNPIQSIVVNNTSVEMKYETISDYTAGKEIPVENHLTVFSNGGYAVNVEAANFNTSGVESKPEVNTIKIYAKIDGVAAYEEPIVKLGAKTQLFSSTSGTDLTGQILDVMYKGGTTYYQDGFFTKTGNIATTTTHTTTVTYSIVAL